MKTHYLKMTCLAALAACGVVAPANQPDSAAARPRVCVVVIDDFSDIPALAKQGIEPCDPAALGQLFDTFAEKNVALALAYIPVRARAEQIVPVVAEMDSFPEVAPGMPDRAGVKLADLQTVYQRYREARAQFDARYAAFHASRQEARERFVRAALDAGAAAEAERDAVRAAKRGSATSDVQGALFAAVSLLKAMGASHGCIVLNTDLRDETNYRRPRTAALTEEELPPNLVKALVFANTSYQPEASSLVSRTVVAKYHAASLRAAADQVAALLPASR